MIRAVADQRDATFEKTPTQHQRLRNMQVYTVDGPLRFVVMLIAGRIRRVKCDEGHPSCTRCSSTGRKCDYYNKQAPPPPAAYLLVIQVPRSPPPHARYIDLRIFDCYHRLLAPTLLNYGGEHFWNRLVLQACHHDEGINHLIMATTWAGIRNSKILLPGIDSPNAGLNYFSHYGKGLEMLGRAESPDPGVILMACLILMLCDELQENQYGALRHLMSGRKMITSYMSRNDRRYSDTSIAEIVRMFSRLELHTGEINHIATGRSLEILKSGAVPTRSSERLFFKFGSVDEAVNTLHRIAIDGARLQLNCSPPASRFHVVPNLTLRLNDWLHRFCSSEVGTQKERQILRLYHLSLDTLSRCAPFNNESAFDVYLSNIEQLVIVCNLRVFSTTPSLIPVLFFVATRYRSASVRRRAIELLRSCGTDGRILAAIAMKVVWVEERNVSEPITSADIPEGDRIRLVGMHTGASPDSLLVDYRVWPYRPTVPMEIVTVPIRRLSLAIGDFDPVHAVSI
ncbi:hypothetical protein PV08_11912 [Exophiala spinifera]|uniref:Zn(2)-C6 fungal-type domain-containing protein n=1 Tax=Exophiala spinifera TaxID=91928 RepID=A0A0D1Y4C7_9EURO|nr:uncharacterized protein PV08_11912 [Exophiala spinifera]KIW09811.1 hypothetical protein PV08_11912 [Exophiala spinifera]